MAFATGRAEELTGFVDKCMAEYDLDGWKVPDLVNPTDVNVIMKKPKHG
jgi:4-hydroxyphenylacetate 3-monooxygenase